MLPLGQLPFQDFVLLRRPLLLLAPLQHSSLDKPIRDATEQQPDRALYSAIAEYLLRPLAEKVAHFFRSRIGHNLTRIPPEPPQSALVKLDVGVHDLQKFFGWFGGN